jgi:UDP-glucose 4-epimerase
MSYILVTGGAGYIGSVLANKLCKNYRVIVIDNLSNGSSNFLNKNIIFHKIDICNYKKLKNIFSKYNIVSVFHFAALKLVSDSQKYYKKYFKNNVYGTVNLLKNIASFKVGEIIFSSSSSVYGDIDKKRVRETDPLKPISNYAKTKLLSERDIMAYAKKFHFKFCILRYFNVMGADKNLKSGELIYTPSYYFIGHFSKFIGKEAKRISSVASRSQLLTTSFLNKDGKVVTIVMNQSNKKLNYNLCVGTKSTVISILPHAIQTVVY